MEIGIDYQNKVRIGDPKRNKFAITSFVISLISVILSPLIIPQVLGIIFAALGLKSEKKGLSIAGLVINIFAVLLGIVLLVSIISVSIFGSVVNNAKIKDDQQMTIRIQNAIVDYIQDTGDIDLKFGAREAPSVKEVLLKLQDKVTVNGKDYGPYLNLDSNNEEKEIKPDSSAYKGWEININKEAGTVEVKLSETEDSLLIK